MIDALRLHINKSQKVLITTHKSPDGDAIGSVVSWYFFLKNLGKEVYIIIPDQPADFLVPFLKDVDYSIFDQGFDKEITDFDTLYCLDYNGAGRVGKDMESFVLEFPSTKVMIDHHPHPQDFCEIMISRPEVCSTAQLIFECIEEMGYIHLLDVPVGIGIYLGMLTDTGSFRFPSVKAKTHEVLAYLLKIGVDHVQIHEAIYDVNTVSRLQLRGYAIAEKLELFPGLPIGLISLSLDELRRFDYQKGDTEGLVNVILSIEGISIAAFFVEHEDGIKISFRSKGKYFVNEFSAKNFMGGGHQYAAGGFSNDSLSVTIDRFRSLVGELTQTK
jgi:phosphoesterase RecJ-like protein